MRAWRNGRRGRLKICCSKERGGSSPLARTNNINHLCSELTFTYKDRLKTPQFVPKMSLGGALNRRALRQPCRKWCSRTTLRIRIAETTLEFDDDDYLRAFSEIRVPLRWPTAPPNLEPRDDIWPTEPAPIIRRREHGVELLQLRWGFSPARAGN
jgi:hypothetical protein